MARGHPGRCFWALLGGLEVAVTRPTCSLLAFGCAVLATAAAICGQQWGIAIFGLVCTVGAFLKHMSDLEEEKE